MTIASWFTQLTGSSMTLDNLENLLLMQLRDLYSAERQLIDALPKMADAATSKELKRAFQSHLRETRTHASRLEQIFKILDQDKGNETCEAMKGLIAEGSEVIKAEGDPSVKDAALIAAAQRVEHYEIAGYGCVRAFARRLGRTNIATLLKATLDEEGNADKTLTQIAEADTRLDAGDSEKTMPAKSEEETTPAKPRRTRSTAGRATAHRKTTMKRSSTKTATKSAKSRSGRVKK